MYPTHSAVLRVSPKDGAVSDPGAIHFAVRQAVETWIDAQSGGPAGTTAGPRIRDDEAELRRETLGDGDARRGEILTMGGVSVRDWAWEGWVERPLLPDHGCDVARTLRTDVQMRQSDEVPDQDSESIGAVRVTIREQLAFEEGVRPPSRQATMASPCSLLDALFEGFRVFQGNIEWTRTYSAVSTPAHIDRLYESIVDRQRTIPLVVCVGDESQGPPVDPRVLGSELFGTARIFHIANPRLTGRLRERIGEKHRVGWNVLRLFRPGYSPNDEPGVHRFFRRQEIEGTGKGAFPQWLSSYIRREETYSIAPDSVVRDRLRVAQARQTDQALGLIDSLLEDFAPHVGVVGMESLRDAVNLMASALDTALDQRAGAEALATSYARELDDLRDERHRLRGRIEQLKSQIRNTTQAFLPGDGPLPEPKTVKEAVDQVQSTIREGELVFHDRVIRQVGRYRSGYNPAQVRESLIAIRDVARCCRGDHGDGRTPADYFRERGLVLKTDISDTAKNQFRGDYEMDIQRDGATVQVLMGPHLDLSPRQRVYWYHDKEASRFVIGHIGDHLRDASTK